MRVILAGGVMAGLVSLLLIGCHPATTTLTDVRYSIEPVFTYPVTGGEVELGVRFTIGAEPVIPQAYSVLRDGGVAILDTELRQVVMFRDSGPVHIVPLPDVWSGTSVAVDANNDLYVWDQFRRTVHQVRPSGEKIAEYSFAHCEVGHIPRLKPDRDGRIKLAVVYDEYGMDQRLEPGLTFPGVSGRHTVSPAGTGKADILINDRRRWTVQAGDLKDVRLLGYNTDRQLVALGVDITARPGIYLFLLARDGSGTRGLLDLPELAAAAEHAFSVGADGRIYLLGFTATDMVLFTIGLEPRSQT